MLKSVVLHNEIEVQVRQSARARQLRIVVYPDGTVKATQPRILSDRGLVVFLENKAEWIKEKIEYFLARPQVAPVSRVRHSKKEIALLREHARTLVYSRLEYFNQHYGFEYNNVFIRDQKTRWGSCSAKKNLNFNYKIATLPMHLADYLVVHELCHLGEFNHSSAFWNLVVQTIPDYKVARNELKKISTR